MSQPLFTDKLPTTHGDLYVKCNEAVTAQSGKGTNFKGAVIRSADQTTVASGDLYLIKWALPKDGPLTNPFRLKMGRYDDEKDRQYWDAEAIDGQPVLEIKAAPPQKEGGYKGGKRGHQWTPKQLEACYEYWLMFMEGKYGTLKSDTNGEYAGPLAQALAYAVDGMVEISSMACKPEDFTGEPKPEHPSDDDDGAIPF